ncbi:hypothetical protein H2O14_24775 [Rhizobium sp. G21]|nr:hypothetical protein [Rhizobium sp. G21]MBB1251449.1 hypothetical protein [Rhizobium sp. G21]
MQQRQIGASIEARSDLGIAIVLLLSQRPELKSLAEHAHAAVADGGEMHLVSLRRPLTRHEMNARLAETIKENMRRQNDNLFVVHIRSLKICVDVLRDGNDFYFR